MLQRTASRHSSPHKTAASGSPPPPGCIIASVLRDLAGSGGVVGVDVEGALEHLRRLILQLILWATTTDSLSSSPPIGGGGGWGRSRVASARGVRQPSGPGSKTSTDPSRENCLMSLQNGLKTP